MERLNYGSRLDYDDYEEHYGHDSDHDLEDEGHEEGLRERVEHQADYPADDSVDSHVDFDAQLGWRSKAHRRERGRFVPPDTRGYAAPVFVQVADLQARAPAGSEEERDPGA